MDFGPLTRLFARPDGAPRVVRARTRRLRAALVAVAGLVLVFALYVMYELGRYNAGYDRQVVAQQRSELQVQIDKLEKSNREMRTKLAEADTVQMGRSQEQATLARTVGDLQAQVAHQSQELAFYRGVVAQGAASIGVKIQQLRITAGKNPGDFVLHLSLVRTGRPDGEASGTIGLTLDGTANGQARSLDLNALTVGHLREARYGFRYLQDLEIPVNVPPVLKPEQLQIELRTPKKDVAPLSQSFMWTVDSTP
jgi:hypothetical protein